MDEDGNVVNSTVQDMAEFPPIIPLDQYSNYYSIFLIQCIQATHIFDYSLRRYFDNADFSDGIRHRLPSSSITSVFIHKCGILHFRCFLRNPKVQISLVMQRKTCGTTFSRALIRYQHFCKDGILMEGAKGLGRIGDCRERSILTRVNA